MSLKTYSKLSEIVKINSFNNEHNYSLISIIYKIILWFQKLTAEMLVNIEKYIIQE